MRNNAAIDRNGVLASFVRVIWAFAGASLIALAFGFAILLIGLPIALSVRVVHESLSWLVRWRGEVGAAAEALVSVASVLGGIVLTAAFARALVGIFRSRRALGGEARSRNAGIQPALGRELRPAES